MTIKIKTTEEQYAHFIDNLVDEVGSKIEGIYPYLDLVKDKKKDTPEYRLLDRIWVDWCDYLEAEN